MKRIIIMSLVGLLFTISYTTPTMAKTHEAINNENVVERTIEEKKRYTLYVGVEEAFNIEEDTSDITPIECNYPDKEYMGWVTSRLNVRKEPNLDSEIVGILEFNEAITYRIYDDEWLVTDYNGTLAYVFRDFVSVDGNGYEEYSVPNNSGFKSFMPYKSITNKSSKQYQIQSTYAYTGNHGIRMVANRYCIALGTHFDATVGTYVDLVLENNTVIPCVVSEIKADKDTDARNIVTKHNGCVSEFLVNEKIMNDEIKKHGDVSVCKPEWNSPIKAIRVYERGIL